MENKLRRLQKNLIEAKTRKKLAEEELKKLHKRAKKEGINPHNLEIEKSSLEKEIKKLEKSLSKEIDYAESIIAKNG